MKQLTYTDGSPIKEGDVVNYTWDDPRCNALGQAVVLKRKRSLVLVHLIEFATCIKPAFDTYSVIKSDMIFFPCLDEYGKKRNVFKKKD